MKLTINLECFNYDESLRAWFGVQDAWVKCFKHLAGLVIQEGVKSKFFQEDTAPSAHRATCNLHVDIQGLRHHLTFVMIDRACDNMSTALRMKAKELHLDLSDAEDAFIAYALGYDVDDEPVITGSTVPITLRASDQARGHLPEGCFISIFSLTRAGETEVEFTEV